VRIVVGGWALLTGLTDEALETKYSVKLTELAHEIGVCRANLRKTLGEELIKCWHIGPKDSPDEVRTIVIRQIERLIELHVKEHEQSSVRMSFNIGQVPELSNVRLQGRREWYVSNGPKNTSTSLRSSGRILKTAVQEFAKSLVENPPPPPAVAPEHAVVSILSSPQPYSIASEDLPPKASRRKRGVVWTAATAGVAAVALIISAALGLFRSSPHPSQPPVASTTAPISITVGFGYPIPFNDDIGLHWVFPTTANKLPAATQTSREDDAISYATANNGILSDGSIITLTVEGASDHAVVLMRMHVIVLRRRPAVRGTFVGFTSAGGGGPNPSIRQFSTSSLDNDPVGLALVTGRDQNGNDLPTVSFPYQVSADDPLVLEIAPYATKYEVDWQMELDWVADGVAGTTIVDDYGKPFQFTGSSAAASYIYDPDSLQWTPYVNGDCLNCTNNSR
jgi:hypothetical protein